MLRSSLISASAITIICIAVVAAEPVQLTIADDRGSLAVTRIIVDKTSVVEMKVGDKYVPIVGEWKWNRARSTFVPRYPFEKGITIRVTIDGKPIEIATQAASTIPANTVTKIYPTSETIPANQLRFYIEFAEPMRPGYAWSHIELLDEKGNKLDSPFLELDEELWSGDRKRFTLLLDPGRVKQELKPRLEDGPALEVDREYTLKISRRWKDEEGREMKQDGSKTFKTRPAVSSAIDPARWKLTVPSNGTKSLDVDFGRVLDFALCERVFSVIDEKGTKVECDQVAGPDQRTRRFSLKDGWLPGRYTLETRNILEDGCGNRIGRAFEVDLVEPITPKIVQSTTRIPFEVK